MESKGLERLESLRRIRVDELNSTESMPIRRRLIDELRKLDKKINNLQPKSNSNLKSKQSFQHKIISSSKEPNLKLDKSLLQHSHIDDLEYMKDNLTFELSSITNRSKRKQIEKELKEVTEEIDKFKRIKSLHKIKPHNRLVVDIDEQYLESTLKPKQYPLPIDEVIYTEKEINVRSDEIKNNVCETYNLELDSYLDDLKDQHQISTLPKEVEQKKTEFQNNVDLEFDIKTKSYSKFLKILLFLSVIGLIIWKLI